MFCILNAGYFTGLRSKSKAVTSTFHTVYVPLLKIVKNVPPEINKHILAHFYIPKDLRISSSMGKCVFQ